MVSAPGELRPHWQKYLASLERLGAGELALRADNARRIIREHGVTYNIYNDPQGMERPWELDMLPLLIPSSEWNKIEAGLIQRSKLFNIILSDLYGPQRLLREGHLPAALVYANPNFLCGLATTVPIAHGRSIFICMPPILRVRLTVSGG